MSEEQVADDSAKCDGTEVRATNFKEDCQLIRAFLEDNKRTVMALMLQHDDFDKTQSSENPPRQYGEMKANIMLTYRHLEDARMRLGKAIQAYDGGKSCYPK